MHSHLLKWSIEEDKSTFLHHKVILNFEPLIQYYGMLAILFNCTLLLLQSTPVRLFETIIIQLQSSTVTG